MTRASRPCPHVTIQLRFWHIVTSLLKPWSHGTLSHQRSQEIGLLRSFPHCTGVSSESSLQRPLYLGILASQGHGIMWLSTGNSDLVELLAPWNPNIRIYPPVTIASWDLNLPRPWPHCTLTFRDLSLPRPWPHCTLTFRDLNLPRPWPHCTLTFRLEPPKTLTSLYSYLQRLITSQDLDLIVLLPSQTWTSQDLDLIVLLPSQI